MKTDWQTVLKCVKSVYPTAELFHGCSHPKPEDLPIGILVDKVFKSKDTAFFICEENSEEIHASWMTNWGSDEVQSTATITFKGKLDSTEAVLATLNDCIEKYKAHEREFYQEGIDANMQWGADLEEAKRLNALIFDDPLFLKEMCIE